MVVRSVSYGCLRNGIPHRKLIPADKVNCGGLVVWFLSEKRMGNLYQRKIFALALNLSEELKMVNDDNTAPNKI